MGRGLLRDDGELKARGRERVPLAESEGVRGERGSVLENIGEHQSTVL